ncbi:hypothetical protein GEMRC1_013671 [Eukaryota sp. GEM-RC1]
MNVALLSTILALLAVVAAVLIRRGVGLNLFRRKKEIPGLFIGLDGSGKTTFLYMLRDGEVYDTLSTIGFNIEEIDIAKNTFMCIFDVGGQDKIRPLWRHYYFRASFLAFFIDGSKPERFGDAKEELLRLDNEAEIGSNVPRVILCNKKDLPDYLSSEEVSRALGLADLTRHWDIIETSGTKKEHVEEFLDWIRRTFQLLST